MEQIYLINDSLRSELKTDGFVEVDEVQSKDGRIELPFELQNYLSHQDHPLISGERLYKGYPEEVGKSNPELRIVDAAMIDSFNYKPGETYAVYRKYKKEIKGILTNEFVGGFI